MSLILGLLNWRPYMENTSEMALLYQEALEQSPTPQMIEERLAELSPDIKIEVIDTCGTMQDKL